MPSVPPNLSTAIDSKPGEHQPAGPAGVQDVEPMRFVVAVDRGDDRVDHRFDRAVGQRVDERGDVEHLEVGRENRQQRRDDVAHEGEDHRRAVADAVDDQAEQNDRDGERIEADAVDDALLLFGEIELRSQSSSTAPRTAKPNAVATSAMKQPRNNRRECCASAMFAS